MTAARDALLAKLDNYRTRLDALRSQVDGCTQDRASPMLIGAVACLQDSARQCTEAVGVWVRDTERDQERGRHDSAA